MTGHINETLADTLQVAVPLRINELHRLRPDERDERIRRWAQEAADIVAQHGDKLMFRDRHSRRGIGTAGVFDALARGLAAGAWVPGGVTWAGLHWCTQPHDQCPRRTRSGAGQ